MKAVFLEKPFVLTMQDIEKPVPGTDEVLLRVLSAGICGSELHAYHGKHSGRVPPAVMGHEGTARVESTPSVSASSAAEGAVVSF